MLLNVTPWARQVFMKQTLKERTLWDGVLLEHCLGVTHSQTVT